MGELLIIHGTIFTVDSKDRVIDDGALFVQGNRIVDVGLSTKLLQKYPKVKQLDASGMVVLPGLINSHTHLSMTMTRASWTTLKRFIGCRSSGRWKSISPRKRCILVRCLELQK